MTFQTMIKTNTHGIKFPHFQLSTLLYECTNEKTNIGTLSLIHLTLLGSKNFIFCMKFLKSTFVRLFGPNTPLYAGQRRLDLKESIMSDPRGKSSEFLARDKNQSCSVGVLVILHASLQVRPVRNQLVRVLSPCL